MESSKQHWQDDFNEVVDSGRIESLDAQVIADSRRKFESGQILQGRIYSRLPDNTEDAFKETTAREQAIINDAKKKLGEGGSIHG